MAFICYFKDINEGYLCHLPENIVIKWHIKEEKLWILLLL